MKFKISALLALAVALIGTSIFSGQASAARPDGKLFVTPSYFRASEYLKPGETFDGSFKVYNTNDSKDYTFFVTVESLEIQGTNYDTSWGQSPTQFNKIIDYTTISIGTGSENSYTLAPDEEMIVNYSIDLPERAAGGSQYMAFVVHFASDQTQSEGWKVNTSISALFFANVDGDVDMRAEVLEQEIEKFSTRPSIKSASLVTNTGNVDILAKYTLVVRDLFGKELHSQETERIVVPGTDRVSADNWEEAPSFGIFRVEYTIALHDGDHTVIRTVLIAPIWLIIVIVLFIIACIASIVYGHKQRVAKKQN